MAPIKITGGGADSADPFGWGIATTFPGVVSSGADITATASRCWWARSYGAIPAATKIGLEVVTAAGNIDVGIYAGATGLTPPTTKRGSSGTTACPTAGYAEVSLTATVAMSPGDYLAFGADATGGMHIRGGGQGQGAMNLFKGQVYLLGSTYPLPSPAGAVIASQGFGMMLLAVP